MSHFRDPRERRLQHIFQKQIWQLVKMSVQYAPLVVQADSISSLSMARLTVSVPREICFLFVECEDWVLFQKHQTLALDIKHCHIH